MKIEYINCPLCGKQLINLSDEIDKRCGYNVFWCDECHIDISVETDEHCSQCGDIFQKKY